MAEADLFEAVQRLELSSSAEIGPQSGTEPVQSANNAESTNAENSL